MTPRRGFTLIETLIALVMLTVISFGLMRFSGLQVRGTAGVGARMVATGVAAERLGQIKGDPAYTNLVTKWAGTTTGFTGYTSMARTTSLRRVRDTIPPVKADYTIVTVSVTDPQLTSTVSVTSVVAAP